VLTGDGKATPTIHGIDVTSPRATSARYMPGAFSADETGADFLARFLGLFDELRERTLDPVAALPAFFDPLATAAAEAGAPGADFLDWLGSWIGIALDRHWSVARRRRLVKEAPALFRMRGTVEGLVRFVQIYTGAAPRLVEHFRLRRWLALDETPLDGGGTLWGPEIVRRLELDRYSEIGRFALVDGGDPLVDPVAAFAHRCTLYVPVGDNFSDRDAAALDDVVAIAAPAHVAVEVKLMRPRFVIGCDCLLGVNTILGSDCREARADDSVLGEDIRLAGPPTAFTLGPGMRLGPDTTLQ
jgi:phage tail-like protein